MRRGRSAMICLFFVLKIKNSKQLMSRHSKTRFWRGIMQSIGGILIKIQYRVN